MAPAISMDILQLLQDKLGKEEGRKVAEAIEIGLDVIEKKAELITLQKKLELKDELTRELVTKADFYGEMKALRQEMQTIRTDLEGKIENVKVDLEGKIGLVKAEVKRVDMKLNFLIILVIIALTLMNPVAAEIIKHLLGF